MAQEQVQYRMPDTLMRVIRRTVADEGLTVQDRFEAVVVIAHAYGLFSGFGEGEFSPTRQALPEAQWQEIAEMLMNMPVASNGISEMGRVNLSLDWMNVGPSSYVPTPDATIVEMDAHRG